MNVQKKTLLFGTLLTGGIVGLMYAFSKLKNQKNPIRRARQVPKEVIIRVLKEIDNEMFSVLSNIAMVANQLKQQARGRLSNEEIRDFLLNHTPQTKEQIKNVSETVCRKHGLEEIDLRYACEVTFQNDRDIQALLSEAKAIFDKAFIGIPPEVKTDVPDFLTAELTLTLLKTIMKESLFKVQDFLADLKKKGVRISTENPQVLMGLQNLKIDDIRKKILNDKGLNKYREPALKIFQYAIQKYTQQNPDNFSQKMLKLEMQNQRAMKALMNGANDAFTMIDAIGAHLAQSPEDLISSHLKNKRLHKTAASQNQGARRKSRDDEETAKALNDIKNLQNQISFQLKNNLEDSQFPQELVQSAVNTLFNVFDNMKKDLSPSEAKQNDAIKAQSQQTIVVVPEVNREEEKIIATEPSEVEIKEARGAEGANQVEEKVVIATEDAQTQESKVQEAVTEENPEASN